MATMQDNATRVKRFRELKATLRTNRQRLLVGLDVAQAEHVVQMRLAHTRIVGPTLTVPNSTRGFTQLWTRIQQAQRATGCAEVVCSIKSNTTLFPALTYSPPSRCATREVAKVVTPSRRAISVCPSASGRKNADPRARIGALCILGSVQTYRVASPPRVSESTSGVLSLIAETTACFK
jgi:hypothetical protein